MTQGRICDNRVYTLPEVPASWVSNVPAQRTHAADRWDTQTTAKNVTTDRYQGETCRLHSKIDAEGCFSHERASAAWLGAGASLCLVVLLESRRRCAQWLHPSEKIEANARDSPCSLRTHNNVRAKCDDFHASADQLAQNHCQSTRPRRAVEVTSFTSSMTARRKRRSAARRWPSYCHECASAHLHSVGATAA